MNRESVVEFLKSIGLEGWADSAEHLAGVEKVLEALREPAPEAARAVMEARCRWGWTFGKRRQVMAIDKIMARAALSARFEE